MPRTCDDFHRQKTFVLRILSLSPISVYFYFFLLSHRSVQLLSCLVGESKCIFLSFSSPKMLRKCEVCCCFKLVKTANKSYWPYQGGNSTFLGKFIYEIINKKKITNYKSEKHTKYSFFSKWLLRHGVVHVFVSFCVLVLYGPFCHGALKLDISTLFTTFFIWSSLQFIL